MALHENRGADQQEGATHSVEQVPVDEETLSWALLQLKRRCEELEFAGNYEEAERVSAYINKLESYDELSKREQLRSLHLLQRVCVDDSHKEECEKFQQTWERNICTFEENAAAMERELEERHHRELVLYLERITCDVHPRAPRWSKQLLSLRKQEWTQAKAKNYKQAKKLKDLADDLETREICQWRELRDRQIRKKEEAMRGKQRIEMQGLLARIESGRQELYRTRDAAKDVLLRRYANVKHQLETEQKIAKLKTSRQTKSRLR